MQVKSTVFICIIMKIYNEKMKICEMSWKQCWGKFNAVYANLKKEETFQINNLNIHLKKLERRAN